MLCWPPPSSQTLVSFLHLLGRVKNGLERTRAAALSLLDRWSAVSAPRDSHGAPYRSSGVSYTKDSQSSSSTKASTTIAFKGTVYDDGDAAALTAAIASACAVQPCVRSLRSCVEAAFKPLGCSGGITMHSSDAREIFDWHISKGQRASLGKQTGITCSLFGSRDPKTGALLLTAVGRHLRSHKGKQHYTLEHWRDGSVACRTFTI